MSKQTTTQAAQADVYALFQESVQDPDFEVDFIETQFRALRGREPHVLREDFCGTAALSAQWGRRALDAAAHGVDTRGDMLEWGQAHNLTEPVLAKRVQLHRGDVANTATPTADVITALNFAYSQYKTRAALRDYFAAARSRLNSDGLMVLDAFGGSEVMGHTMDETEMPDHDAVFIWDQEHFNVITHELLAHIHFEFADGSELEKAFTFDWRIWTLPELQELLLEAGFKKVHVYWEKFIDAHDLDDEDEDEDEALDDEDLEEDDEDEEFDEDDEFDELDDTIESMLDDEDDDHEMIGTGEYHAQVDAENQESWVAYIIAEA